MSLERIGLMMKDPLVVDLGANTFGYRLGPGHIFVRVPIPGMSPELFERWCALVRQAEQFVEAARAEIPEHLT